MGEKMVKAVRVDPELWNKARVKALSQGVTMENLITQLLKEYLKKKGGK